MKYKYLDFSKIFFSLITFIVAFILLFFLFGSKETIYSLNKSEIRHDQGCAYVAMLPIKPLGYPLMVYQGDGLSDKNTSSLVLLENGQIFAQPHILHDVIRSKGSGYSHWYEGLFFSASDCSNPINNGRVYQVKITSDVNWVVKVLFVLCLLYIYAFLNYNNHFSRITKYLLSHSYLSSKSRLFSSLKDLEVVFFAILIVYFTLSGLFDNWSAGRSLVFSTAAGFPLSDAHGYWNCANVFVDFKSFSGDAWCYRRAIYPEFLAGLIWPVDGEIQYVLVLQALLLDLSIVVVFCRGRYLIGSIGAWILGLMLLAYAMNEAVPYTTTENAGLILGVFGFAALLAVFQFQSLSLLIIGYSFISLALSARAGVLFALPALFIWAFLFASHFRLPTIKWALAALVALLTGFVVQKCLIVFSNGPAGASFGSLSYTLYGLAVGGKGWAQVLTDFPSLNGLVDQEMSRLIYQYAWDKFLYNPQLFFQALWNNTSLFWTNGAYGYSRLGDFGDYAKICWWLSWIALWVSRKEPIAWLICLLSSATLLAMPIIIGDGGARVFAATIAADAFQVAFGLVFCLRCFLNFPRIFKPVFVYDTGRLKVARFFYVEYAVVAFFSLIMISPLLVSRSHAELLISERGDCAEGQYLVRTNLGLHGNNVLDLVDNGSSVDVMHGQARVSDFKRNVPADTWWWDSEIGKDVRAAVNHYGKLSNQAALADSSYPWLYANFSISGYYGKVVDLCIDPNATKNILSAIRRKIVSIRVTE